MQAGSPYRLNSALLCADMAKRQLVQLPADSIILLVELQRDGMARLTTGDRSLLAFSLDLESRSEPAERVFERIDPSETRRDGGVLRGLAGMIARL